MRGQAETGMKLKKWSPVVAILFLVSGILYDIRFLLLYGRVLLDSDMAAEMILAHIENETHSLVSSNWFYSTELRVLHMQWLYRIGLLFSPHNWQIARTIGVALALILLAAGMIEVGRRCGLGVYGVWMAGFAMWPLGFWYHFQSTFGAFYLPYAIISFWCLVCILGFCKANQRKSQIVYAVVLAFLSFVSGMNGTRQMMVFFAPLLVAAVILARNRKFLAASVYAFLWNAAGFLVNVTVLKNYFSFQAREVQVWGRGTGSWLTSLKWFFESFGYCQNRNMGYDDIPLDVELFSSQGIAAGCGLLIGMSILASCIFLIVRYRNLQEWEQMLTVLSLSMLFVIGFVFTYLWGAMQYWQQTMPFGFVVLVLAIKNIPFCKKEKYTLYSFAVAAAYAAFTMFSARGTCIALVENPLRSEAGLEYVVEYIQECTDYEAGYAPFWLCNLTAELSNGELEMYCAANLPDSHDELYTWLQKRDHPETAPDEHYFVILYGGIEQYLDSPIMQQPGAQCIYEDEQYCVIGVD